MIGAGIIRYDQVTDHFWTGLLLVQLSNISFAIGMVGYKRLMEARPMPQHNAFAWFYIGAFLVAVVAWFMLGNAQKMPETTLQWGILVFWAWPLQASATLCGTTARHRLMRGRWVL